MFCDRIVPGLANHRETEIRRVHDPEADLLTGIGSERRKPSPAGQMWELAARVWQYCDHGSHVFGLVKEDES